MFSPNYLMKGFNMKLLLAKTITLLGLFAMCSLSNADTEYRVVHSCEIREGKTMDDVRTANSKWVVFMNENINGGDITSHITTSVIGDTTPGKFGYVDSFPSLESWAAAMAATESIAEGIAIDKELREIADCNENQLYKAEES